MNALLRLVLVSFALTLAACGGGGGDGDAQPDPVVDLPPKVQPTAVGTPIGAAVTKTIGTAGGTLSSADGMIQVDVPPGALSEDETIGIQEITNESPTKFAKAFRLSPEGVTFAKPVRLSFRFTPEQLRGTSTDVIKIAYQTKEGYWASKVTAADPVTGGVSVETDHFSDWVSVPYTMLNPSQAKVKVGKSVNLQISICEDVPLGEPPELIPLCNPSIVVARLAKDWSANGTLGGNSAVGTVSSTEPGKAVYTAPAKKPTANPVAVSVHVTALQERAQITLVSNITVEEVVPAPWQGTIDVVIKGSEDTVPDPYSTEHEELLVQYTYAVSGRDDAPLNGKGTGSYVYLEEYKFDKTEQVYCSQLHPNETRIEKATTTVRDGGETHSDDVVIGLKSRPGNTYILEFLPHRIQHGGTYESFYLYKGPCNPFSDTPEGGITTRSKRSGYFDAANIAVQGTFDPQDPDKRQGTHKFTVLEEGLAATVTVTWNLTRQ